LGEDEWRAGHIHFLGVKSVDIRMTRMLSGIIFVGRKNITATAFNQHGAQYLHFGYIY
jgi:hypothetical protein